MKTKMMMKEISVCYCINSLPNEGSRKQTDFVRHFFNFDTREMTLFAKYSAAQLIRSKSQSKLPIRFVHHRRLSRIRKNPDDFAIGCKLSGFLI